MQLKFQKGFTGVELFIVLSFLFAIGFMVGIGYVAFHFISKFW